MVTRPGFEFIGQVETGARILDYEYSSDETHLLEFGDSSLRIWSNDARIQTAAVSTVIVNGEFTTDLSG